MRVLSLFDGMACGMLAMMAAGVDVDRYDAYEIDKYAVKTATHNFPMIEQHGDVFTADFTTYYGVDFLIGGSPCTYWSIAQTKNRETVASGMGWDLFSQYVRALRESKPRYFIYENNKSMSKEIRKSIDEAFGFEAVCINSALVSAQNRQRLYWVGRRNEDGTYSKVAVEQPEDRGILLKDVLDVCSRIPEYGQAEKSRPVHAGYGKLEVQRFYDRVYAGGAKEQHDYVAEPICLNSKSGRGGVDGLQPSLQDRIYDINGKGTAVTTSFNPNIAVPVCCAERGRYIGENGAVAQHLEARTDGKTNTLTSVEKDNRVAEPVQAGRMPREDGIVTGSKQYRVYDVDGKAVTQCGQGGGLGAKTGLYALPCRVCDINGGGQGNRIYSVNAKSCAIKGSGGGLGGHGQGLYAVPAYECPKDCEIVITDNSIRCMRHDAKRSTVQGSHVNFEDGKVYPVYKVADGKITIKGKQYPIKLVDGYYIIRKLTVKECMRLQTVPEWYDFSCVSNSRAYTMLGNGWTVEVIAHLIRSVIGDSEARRGGCENADILE